MNTYFHYYATYLAARLAGLTGNDAQQLAYYCQSMAEMSVETAAVKPWHFRDQTFTPCVTGMGKETRVISDVLKGEPLFGLHNCELAFQHLPGFISAEVKPLDKPVKKQQGNPVSKKTDETSARRSAHPDIKNSDNKESSTDTCWSNKSGHNFGRNVIKSAWHKVKLLGKYSSCSIAEKKQAAAILGLAEPDEINLPDKVTSVYYNPLTDINWLRGGQFHARFSQKLAAKHLAENVKRHNTDKYALNETRAVSESSYKRRLSEKVKVISSRQPKSQDAGAVKENVFKDSIIEAAAVELSNAELTHAQRGDVVGLGFCKGDFFVASGFKSSVESTIENAVESDKTEAKIFAGNSTSPRGKRCSAYDIEGSLFDRRLNCHTNSEFSRSMLNDIIYKRRYHSEIRGFELALLGARLFVYQNTWLNSGLPLSDFEDSEQSNGKNSQLLDAFHWTLYVIQCFIRDVTIKDNISDFHEHKSPFNPSLNSVLKNRLKQLFAFTDNSLFNEYLWLDIIPEVLTGARLKAADASASWQEGLRYRPNYLLEQAMLAAKAGEDRQIRLFHEFKASHYFILNKAALYHSRWLERYLTLHEMTVFATDQNTENEQFWS